MLLEGVARVLAVDPAALRDDTPLALLGWDSLARACLVDLLAADADRDIDVAGLDRALADAATVGDLVVAREISSAGVRRP